MFTLLVANRYSGGPLDPSLQVFKCPLQCVCNWCLRSFSWEMSKMMGCM